MGKIKKFEWVIDVDDAEHGVKAISFVDLPAMESDFITLNKQEHKPKFIKLEVEGYKNVLAGLAMIPDKEIPRVDPETGEEYVGYFSAKTIEEIRNKFHKEQNDQNVNTNHDEGDTVDAYMISDYIVTTDLQVEDLRAKGIEEAVIGSWYVEYKVEDDAVFEEALEKEINGFSVELYAEKILESFKFEEEDNREVFCEEVQPLILKRLAEVGQTEDELLELGYDGYVEDEDVIKTFLKEQDLEVFITSPSPEKESKYDGEFFVVRYKYKGARDSKNRDFCGDVLDLAMYYRKEDIDELDTQNPDFGVYSVWKYKGSYNCRHQWKPTLFQKTDTTKGKIIPDYKIVVGTPKKATPDVETPAGSAAATSKNSPVSYGKNNNYNKNKFSMKNLLIKFKEIINEFEKEEDATNLERATIPELEIIIEWGETGEAVNKIVVDEAGEESLEPIEDGDYVLEDGRVLVVAEGVLAEIKQATEDEAPAEEEVETEVKAEEDAEVKAEDEDDDGKDTKKTLEELIDLTQDGYYTVEVEVYEGKIQYGSVYANTWKELNFAEIVSLNETMKGENDDLKKEIEDLKAKIKEPVTDPKLGFEQEETEKFIPKNNYERIAHKNGLPVM